MTGSLLLHFKKKIEMSTHIFQSCSPATYLQQQTLTSDCLRGELPLCHPGSGVQP